MLTYATHDMFNNAIDIRANVINLNDATQFARFVRLRTIDAIIRDMHTTLINDTHDASLTVYNIDGVIKYACIKHYTLIFNNNDDAQFRVIKKIMNAILSTHR